MVRLHGETCEAGRLLYLLTGDFRGGMLCLMQTRDAG